MPTTLSSLTLTNAGFETGTMAGWTTSDASLAASTINGDNTPHAGAYHAFAGTTTPTSFWQDFDVSGQGAAIDGGGVTLTGFAAWHATFDPQTDHGHLFAAFLDGVGATLTTAATADTHPADWTLETLADTAVPAGTRTIRLGVVNIRDTGTNNDNYWDDFQSPDLVLAVSDAALALTGVLSLALAARGTLGGVLTLRGALSLRLTGLKDPPFDCASAPAKAWIRSAAQQPPWFCTPPAPPLPCDGNAADAADLDLAGGERLVFTDGQGLKLLS